MSYIQDKKQSSLYIKEKTSQKTGFLETPIEALGMNQAEVTIYIKTEKRVTARAMTCHLLGLSKGYRQRHRWGWGKKSQNQN